MVTMKTSIVDDLGETALLLPARLTAALVANEQAKYLFSLLQNALLQADRPDTEVDGLARERLEVGLDDASLDELVENARAVGEAYRIVDFAGVQTRLLALVDAMLEPLRLTAGQGTEIAVLEACEHRLAAFAAVAASTDANAPVPRAAVLQLIRGTREQGDSLHVLVMDLHKVLNRLQEQLAEETVDGASAYRLEPGHRPLVAAFMAGVNRTAPCKFGHPGLGTTATSRAHALVLQNDIGTTDAHVFVVTVVDETARFVYTDVHLACLEFFRDMLAAYTVDWHDTENRRATGFEQDTYYLCRGEYRAASPDDLQRFLAWLGSRLVFLIDWNKARKRLRELVGKKEAVALLAWAARHEHGHRTFLELGGEQMIYRAIAHAAMGEPHYGQPLHLILGKDQTVEFLKYALRTAALGMFERRDWRLVEDQIRAEMLHYFRSVPQEQLRLVAQHAELVFEAADLVRGALARLATDGARAFGPRALAWAARWEREADRLVNEARTLGRRSAARGRLRVLIEEQDDAMDALEESVFLVTLPSARFDALQGVARALLDRLAGEVVAAAQEMNKALECAQHVHRGGAREDVEDFYRAFERVVEFEHRTDASERALTAELVAQTDHAGSLLAASRLCAGLEAAADTLCRCAHQLRDYLVEEVMAA